MKLAKAIFYTKDIKRIKEFYIDLGFDLDSEEEGKYLSFKFDNDAVLGIKIGNKEREVPGSQTVMLLVEEIDDHYERLKSEGYNIYKHLVVQDWGTSFSILDPDGNKIEFIEAKQ